MRMSASFRNAFYAGLVLAIAAGLFVFQLWQPDRQLELHTRHLLRAIEANDFDSVAKFIDASYADQWGHNREAVLARLRNARQFTRNLQLDAHEPVVFASSERGEWRARVTARSDENEVATFINSRLNAGTDPFMLEWRRQSWKPWDWKLVRVSNPGLELPAGFDAM